MHRCDRILFVDDEPSVRSAFARCMRHDGFIIDVANNGEEARTLAANYQYAVVVTDLCMPGIDGVALIAELQELRPESAYILLSGRTDLDTVKTLQAKRSLEAVILKPWDRDELSELLHRGIQSFRSRQTVGSLLPGAEDRGVRLLLVEDNPIDAEIVSRQLSHSAADRYEIDQVTTLDAAIEAILSSDYDVVLLDLSLPDSSGVSTLQGIQAASSSLPVVVLSGTDDGATAIMAVKAGAQDYLPKGRTGARFLHRSIRYAIERKRSEDRLAYMARFDQLTGLANRTLLREILPQAIARANRRKRMVGLCFIDLDKFKSINDTLGHDAGDTLLGEVAQRLLGSVRETDTVARLGGDEFALVLEDLNDESDVSPVINRILNAFATPARLGDQDVVVSPSIGIAFSPNNGQTVDQLLKAADTAMYRAKELGGNTAQIFSESVHAAIIAKKKLEGELRIAVEKKQFVLFYQPQLDLKTGLGMGAEALLRWQHPDGHLVPPLDFIPLLEESGLIVPVGAWVLDEACAQARVWIERGQPDFRMAVNVSARQFEHAGLVEDVSSALTKNGIAGRNLEIEITESVMMLDTESTRYSLTRLKELGVGVAIDDFGTGYSSLGYLRRFPVDTLKIDRSFVREVCVSEDDARIASAVLGLGRALDLAVVAEGVETQEHINYLVSEGCDFVQGYFIGRPAPAPQMTRWKHRDVLLAASAAARGESDIELTG